MSHTDTSDLVILGGGSGGYACALRAAQLGRSVVLIEQDLLGGTCLHRGCIPTKALLHAGEVADSAREGHQFGVRTHLEGIDMPALQEYKNGVTAKLYRGLQGLVKQRGITLVAGQGRLVDAHTVEVTASDGTTSRYSGTTVVLATGSVPKTLPGLEIDGQRVITSDHALRLDYVPESVVVLGGGVIGVEFASAWRSFGAQVSVVEALPHLVALEDEDISKQLERAYRKRGISYELGSPFTGVEQTDTGVRVHLQNGKTLEAQLLLVAVGRGPVSADLGYEQVGVAMERGYVTVDEYCRTSVPGVYAVGDLIPTLQLAHVGFAEGILVAEHSAGLAVVPIDYDAVPRVTYCEPEVACVGLTEAKARAQYGEQAISTLTYDLAGNGKSTILKTSGFIKLVRVVDGPVVGVHMIGSRVSELIAEGQLITNWQALPAEVAALIHPHPTQSEALGEAHLALAGKPLHAHG